MDQASRDRLLAENSRDMILLTGLDGVLRYVSPASLTMLGYAPEAMVGRSAFEFVHAEDQPRLQASLRNVNPAAKPGPPAEFRMVRKDGRIVWVEATGSLIQAEGIKELQVNVRDVTARRRAEIRFKVLAENSRDLVGLIAPDGTWSYVSPASKAILDLQPSEMEGRNAYDYVHSDDRGLLRTRLMAGLNGERPGVPPEFRMRRRDGSWIWMEGTGARMDQDGNGGGSFQVTLRDITERRQALAKVQEAQRRERGILETISDAYFQLDCDFRLVYMNPVAAKMRVSGPPELVYGQVLWDAFPDLKGSKYDLEYHRALRDNVPVTVEEYYPRMQKWYEARAYPSQQGLSVYFSDITVRKRAEETERLAYQRSLEIASLREINHYKTAFVNTAAHELGNPLTPIRIQTRLLRAAVERGSTPESLRSLDTLDRNVERLVHLVNDILEGARLQASRLVVTPQELDLAPLLRESVDSYRGSAAQAKMQMELDLPATLPAHADPKRIGQVLDNLLSNAVKYGAAGGVIQVRAEPLEGSVHVSVAGPGRGISPDHLPHLFQPFSRIAEEAGSAGSGLGLYICAGIVKNHEGAIWAQSPGPGQGATFHFSFPAQGKDAGAAADAAP